MRWNRKGLKLLWNETASGLNCKWLKFYVLKLYGIEWHVTKAGRVSFAEMLRCHLEDLTLHWSTSQGGKVFISLWNSAAFGRNQRATKSWQYFKFRLILWFLGFWVYGFEGNEASVINWVNEFTTGYVISFLEFSGKLDLLLDFVSNNYVDRFTPRVDFFKSFFCDEPDRRRKNL